MSRTHLATIQDDCCQSLADDVGQLKALRSATLLVTGGTGFVGTWIAEMVAFLNDHHHFNIQLTLLSSRASDFAAYMPHLADRSFVTLVEQDVKNLADISPATDWIIHAAASPDSRAHFSNPVRTLQTIVNGTHSVLDAASRLSSLQRILCLSSGLVSGPQQWESSPIKEDRYSGLDCTSLANLYVESKRAAEMEIVSYRSQFGLPVVIARPFTFAGPYQHLDRPWAINNFLSEALRGGPIRVQGNGDTIRSYMYGSDAAFWLLRLLVSGKIGKAYNVGSPVGISLKNLASKLAIHAASRPVIELNTLPDGHIASTRWLPDVTLAEKDCGVNIRIDLDEAIRRTIAWHSPR